MKWFAKLKLKLKIKREEIKEMASSFNINIKKHGCPDCGCTEFERGPQGGLCINIKCCKCGATYNMGPAGYAERLTYGTTSSMQLARR